MSYPRIIAHRGAGALAPENTLAAMRLAARLGCRAVEFDVMLTADGVPLLIHDETLERTTDGSGRVAAQRFAVLRALDAGVSHGAAFRGEPMPTLEEALDLCAELDLWANVEIKPAAGYEAQTGSVVGRQLTQQQRYRGVVSSFSPQALAAARLAAPQLGYALLVAAIPADWWRATRSIGAMRHSGCSPPVRRRYSPIAPISGCRPRCRRDWRRRVLAPPALPRSRKIKVLPLLRKRP